MANWNGLILTDAGRNLQAKVEAGQATLTLTKFKLGNGAISGQQTLEGLTDLISPKQVIGINTCTPKENGICTITGTIVNTGLTKGYELKELGVFATDPDNGEILYAVTIDTHPDYLQPEGGATVVSAEFSLNIAISNTDKVTAVIDVNGLASIGNVHLLIAEHNRAADAHGNVIDAHNADTDAHINIITAHNTLTAAHTSGIAGNAATATRLKPALNGSRNQCWLLCKLPKAATALVHYKILGAQYYDQYSTLEVVIKNGFGWCKYVGRNTNYQVSVKAYDTGTTIDVYLFVPGYCDYWKLFLQDNVAITELSYKKVGDATYVPAGTLVCDTVTGLGMDGVDIFNSKQMATIDDVNKAGLNLLKRSTAYVVGDIAYSQLLPSWAQLECITAGTTASTALNVTVAGIGQKITDGTAIWILRHKGEMHNVGDIWMFAGTIDNNGYPIHATTGLTMIDCHICDGTNGTVNMLNRFPMGTNKAGGGTTGGANSLALTAAQMPVHGHTGTTAVAGWHGHAASAWTDAQGNHAHVEGSTTEFGVSGVVSAGHGSNQGANNLGKRWITDAAGNHAHNVGLSIGGDGNHQHTFTTANAGSTAAFDNRPAYVAVAFVQKIY